MRLKGVPSEFAVSHETKRTSILAVHTASGILLFQASTFLVALLIARSLGPAGQGRFQLLVALSALLVSFVGMGLDEGASYAIPRYQIRAPDKLVGIVWYSVAVSVAAGAVVGLVIYTQSGRLASIVFGDPTLEQDIGYSLSLIPAMMLVTIAAGILRGLGRSDLRSIVYYHLVGPGFLAAIAFLSLGELTLQQVEVVRVASYATGGVVALILIARVLGQQSGHGFSAPAAADLRSLHRLSGSLILVRLSQYVLEQPTVDVLLVGHLATATAAGVYYAAAKVGLVVSLGLATLTLVVAPVLSQAVARQDGSGLLSAYSWASTWMSVLGVFVGGGTIVLRQDILALFGERYVAGQGILVTFAIGQVLAALLGPNTPLLIATGRVKIEIALTAVFAVTMVLGGLLFGALFGALGVASASAASFLFLAVLRYAICARRYQLSPMRDNARILLVGVIATAAGEIAHRLTPLGGVGMTILSGAVFLVVFAFLGYIALPAIRSAALGRPAEDAPARG